jgi:mannose/fructose/N-acetylgalactosamine-specific phosphotransferase system component IIC
MTSFDPGIIVILGILGGLVAIDGTTFGQFMISRPFVAATLGGWVMGSPQEGAIVGIALEAFHLGVLPVGAAKHPEGGPAAVTTGAFFASGAPEPSILILAVLGGLLLEEVGGRTVHLMRLANVRIIAPKGVMPTLANLERRHLMAVGLDFLRGALLVLAGMLVLAVAVPMLDRHWGLNEAITRWLVIAAMIAMLASSLRILGSKYRFAAVGAAIGFVLLWLGR